jgi:hypothetical protein
MMDFWTDSVKHSVERQLDILTQMTRNLHMADIRGMIYKRPDVVVLQSASGVEIGDERGVGLCEGGYVVLRTRS